MNRRLIVVGDPLANGGRVLPYTGPEFRIHGHQVALIGGRAYCESCHSVGLIAKAGGPRRGFLREAEMALAGDVVVCQCPQHQPVVSTLTSSSSYDDTDYGFRGLTAAPVLASHGSVSSPPMAAAKKVVDEYFEHAPEHEPTLEAICPNMTNKEFTVLVLGLRDDAVKMMERRLKELDLWGKAERARAREWFGTEDENTRQYLRNGLSSCVRVLRGLTGDNFVRYSDEAMQYVGCTAVKDRSGLAAGVCKPDTRTHTIGINIVFCSLRDRSAERDSQLATLIHEVTHFDDTFSSDDDIYTMGKSLSLAKETKRALKNADSITGYVAFGASYAG